MHALHELQCCLGAALADARDETTAADNFRKTSPHVLARLSVYRGNVYGNYQKALTGSYPIVRAIVGNEFFDGMAREYARRYPSICGDLNAYGDRLAEFVAGFPHTADLPYLADVARMEWLAHRAYYAADGTALDAARLAQIPQTDLPGLHPILAPPCALLESRWPLKRLWDVHQDVYWGEIDVDLDSGPHRILIDRPNWRARVQSLSCSDFRFLAGAMNGETLAESLAAALEQDADFDPGKSLAHWVTTGVIIDLSTGTKSRPGKSDA